ncbi:MAG TPA: S8 family serine peptidase [Telluria sp.]
MKTVLAAALLGACVALSAYAGPLGPAQSTSPAQAAAHPLLVMLPMPPQHFRAGADYGSAYPSDAGEPARRRLAQALAHEHGLRVIDNWPMPVIGVDCFVMEPAPGVPAGPLLEALGHDPRVAWVQPVNAFYGMEAPHPPGDPLYPIQPAAAAWHLAELHRISTGRGVRVAVVDSGVDAGHPDLAGQVEVQENFVDDGPVPAESHGTAVAGIVAARAGNGIGIAGVAPDARLMALRACWQGPNQGARCSSFTLGKALNYAIQHGARIINLSLAGPPDRLLSTLVEAADSQGATVIGAVDGAAADGGFPTSVPVVLAVAAQDPAHRPVRANTLLAPGTDIPTCLPGARWGLVSGASYATAHVSGLVALLAQLQPGATPLQLRRDVVAVRDTPALRHTAQIAPQDGGAGTIDACATIARASATCVCGCPPAPPAGHGR